MVLYGRQAAGKKKCAKTGKYRYAVHMDWLDEKPKEDRTDTRIEKFRKLELFEMFAGMGGVLFSRMYDPRTSLTETKQTIVLTAQRIIDAVASGDRAMLEIICTVEFGERNISHAIKVAVFCAVIASRIGLSDEHRRVVTVAGLLHDIGLQRTGNALVDSYFDVYKEGPELYRFHPVISSRIAGEYLGFRGAIAETVLHHHEQLDGKGFPSGLSGRLLSRMDRILFTANMIDNLLERSGYAGMAIMGEVLERAFDRYAAKFDPMVLNTVMELFVGADHPERDYTRSFLQLPAMYKTVRKPYGTPCQILDISGSGVRIRTNEPLDEDSGLKVSFSLQGITSFTNKECQIVRSETDHEGFIYGLLFVSPGAAFADRLDRSLREYMERGQYGLH